jgi:hypothetical protein
MIRVLFGSSSPGGEIDEANPLLSTLSVSASS